MKLTSYTNYALRTLQLAALNAPGLIRIEDVVQIHALAKPHVRKIVHELGKAGLLSTQRGRRGGFQLALPADKIVVGDVVRLTEGNMDVGDVHLQVFHTPGHSPGSVCLYWPDEKVLVSGDLIFKEGLGRTDLPGGDGDLIKQSIKRMAELDVELVLPGHGEIIAGAAEVKANFDQLESYWFNVV